MTICYIGIGSNLGDRRRYIDRAIRSIERSPGIHLKRASSIYETDPMGGVPQGKFLNGVLEIETALTPKALLKKLNGIEEALGRKRAVKNGPRTIDLDILYYGEEIIDDGDLVIPHPRINEREFVLKGLRELNRA
ncbi:MAG: 2-amino-4-hydroxy-6-hydroxymethyldihydropteridine diphosphokinase [Candidatus Omnitrophica bacterium]|nr:2-amino-4-hydroxy-6-hydroxymethyldihydropteridine diphosphokinase [Candidatus Omnitrophota bacterium]